MMKGWKTWVGVVGMVALAVYDLSNGDVEQAMAKATAAFGLLGLGHKIDKTA